MARMRVLYDNLWSRSTSLVSALSAASGLPATASQNPQRTYLYRSLSQNGTQALDIDLGSVQAVTCVAVADPRLLSGGGDLKLQQRGDAGAPGAAVDVVTLPLADADSAVAIAFFASQSHRHWRLLWSNPGAVTDYAEVGYVFLGTYYEPPVNYSVPSDGDDEDPSIAASSLDGQKDFVRRSNYAYGTCSFFFANETQLADLRTLKRMIGKHTPFFLMLDTTLAWTAWLCRLTSGIKWRLEEVSGRYTVSFDWEEAR